LRFPIRKVERADRQARRGRPNKNYTYSFDSHDVREWFAADPSACISDIAGRRILRKYEHPYRWWIKFPGPQEEALIRSHFEKPVRIAIKERAARSRKGARASIEKNVRELAERGVRERTGTLAQRASQALVDDQLTPWWQSLRNHLAEFLPNKIVDRFADYLAGFVLVLENETPRSSVSERNGNKNSINERRELKKLLRTLNGGAAVSNSMLPPCANPPHREALKTSLMRILSDELFALDYKRKEIALTFLPQIWDAIGERILPSSFLRSERRSRQRTSHRK